MKPRSIISSITPATICVVSWTCLASLLFVLVTSVACGSKKSGGDGQDGDNGQDGVSSDALPGSIGPRGVPGRNGSNGRDGATGPQGEKGEGGKDGKDGRDVMLLDADGQVIGSQFTESGDTASVFMNDGKRLLVDRSTGEIQSLQFGFFCLYQSHDCSGTCHVYDWRWLGVVVRNEAGQVFVAPNTAVNQGPQTMESYVDQAGVCQEATISTAESYIAQSYVPTNFSFPLKAPLSWSLRVLEALPAP